MDCWNRFLEDTTLRFSCPSPTLLPNSLPLQLTDKMTSLFPFPTGYGYVYAVLGGSFFLNIYLSINVALARRKYDVKYPSLYAPLGHKHEMAFNCVQRAHQQTLESFSYVCCSRH